MSRLVAAPVLVLFASLAGCSGPAPTAPDVPFRQRTTLAPGEATGIAGTTYALRFDRVENDSRCPGDALCIQGGDAVVRVTVLAPTSAQAYELHTGSMAPFVYDDLTIALEQLAPYPFSSLGPIAPDAYRATLVITR